MAFLQEFKNFAMRGNVLYLAVGVVVGGAFGKIVSSLVEAVIMPVVGLLTAGQDVSKLALTLGTTPKGEPVLLRYGAFCQSVIDFLIIACIVFVAVRAINRLQAPPSAPPAPAAPSRSEQLLEEIRDLLARR